jgi:phage-related protein
MPLSVNSASIYEKNLLVSDGIWYAAMKISIPNTPSATELFVVRNNEPIFWRANTYQPFPFEIDDIPSEGKDTVPRVQVRISDVSRAMEQYVMAYDAHVKAYGYSPIEVNFYILNSKNLASNTPTAEFLFELKKPKTSALWATFDLGASNPYNKRFPQERILKNHCRHIFKDELCKFSGSTPSVCGKTYTACTSMMWAAGSYGNTKNFGGFVGVGEGGVRIV